MNARAQSQHLAARIKGAHTNGEFKTYGEIETIFGLDLASLVPSGVFTDEAKQMEVPRWQLDNLLQFFVATTEDRLRKSRNNLALVKQTKLRLTPERECFSFPNSDVTLFPEQDAVCREIYRRMFTAEKPVNNILVPGGTGAGKTIIGVRWLYQLIYDQQYHLPPAEFPIPSPVPLQWVTVPNAVEQTKEEIERCGLAEHLGRSIHVFGYNALFCSEGINIFTQEEFLETANFDEDPDAESKVKRFITWLRQSVARGLVIDECHKLANPESSTSQLFLDLSQAIAQLPFYNTKCLWLSATPFEKVEDSRVFVSFVRPTYSGVRITPDNFTMSFANPISNGKPTVVTAASMERLFEALSPNIVEVPYIAWPRKAINAVREFDFICQADKDYVNDAWERHLERCRAVGKKTPKGFGAVYASFTIFRKDVEHVRIPQIVEEMVANVAQGNSSVCGTAFTGAIIKGIFKLIDDYKIPREQISVIWGGRQNIKPERILSQMDMVNIVQQAIESGEGMDADTKRLIKRNLAWQEDQLLFGDSSDAAQDERYARLQSLRLIGIQTKQRRQEEIDRMKSGVAKYCFFTLASGGTGLSLPHADARTTPRRGWFTPIYSGKEFTQAFGRLPRRVSISDTYQFCCVMRGTIESSHVAPILDNKLQAVGAFTSRKTDIMAALCDIFINQKDVFMKRQGFKAAEVRSLDVVTEQALNDEETQYHGGGAVDDDDDND